MSFDPFRQWQTLAGIWPQRDTSTSTAGSWADLAERFNAAAGAFLSSQRPGAPAAEAFGRFLREQFSTLSMPWSAATPSAGAADALALGATREYQQRLQRIAQAAEGIDAAQRRLQLLWADALRDAASAYCAELSPTAAGDAGPEALRALYDRWIECAEQAYARMAHGQAYCDALADYVNAGSRWRAEMQASLEQWAKLLDLPTRSEINTLIQRLHALEAAQRPRPAPVREPSKPRAKPRARSAGRQRRARKS